MPLAVIAVLLAPEYRAYSQVGADNSRIKSLSGTKTTSAILDGVPAECYTMAYQIHTTQLSGSYEYGLGIYNRLISYFVPRSIFGEEFKQALFLNRDTADEGNTYNWTQTYGMVPTGPASAFVQFGYLGVLVFYYLARCMRRLFDEAVVHDRVKSQILYLLFLTPAISSLTNSIYDLLNPLILLLPLVLVLCALGARTRPRVRAIWPESGTPMATGAIVVRQ
jgi:hypothetical protein